MGYQPPSLKFLKHKERYFPTSAGGIIEVPPDTNTDECDLSFVEHDALGMTVFPIPNSFIPPHANPIEWMQRRNG